MFKELKRKTLNIMSIKEKTIKATESIMTIALYKITEVSYIT